jgi:hypothetical protein
VAHDARRWRAHQIEGLLRTDGSTTNGQIRLHQPLKRKADTRAYFANGVFPGLYGAHDEHGGIASGARPIHQSIVAQISRSGSVDGATRVK